MTTTRKTDAPAEQLPSAIREALAGARSAEREAECLEANARLARRRAASRWRRYDALLAEHGGQMTLDYGTTS